MHSFAVSYAEIHNFCFLSFVWEQVFEQRHSRLAFAIVPLKKTFPLIQSLLNFRVHSLYWMRGQNNLQVLFGSGNLRQVWMLQSCLCNWPCGQEFWVLTIRNLPPQVIFLTQQQKLFWFYKRLYRQPADSEGLAFGRISGLFLCSSSWNSESCHLHQELSAKGICKFEGVSLCF